MNESVLVDCMLDLLLMPIMDIKSSSPALEKTLVFIGVFYAVGMLQAPLFFSGMVCKACSHAHLCAHLLFVAKHGAYAY